MVARRAGQFFCVESYSVFRDVVVVVVLVVVVFSSKTRIYGKSNRRMGIGNEFTKMHIDLVKQVHCSNNSDNKH